jgi:hypothetical protein
MPAIGIPTAANNSIKTKNDVFEFLFTSILLEVELERRYRPPLQETQTTEVG